MTNLVKNIQNKPEHIKRFIMWSGVFFVMAAIFIFWLFTFPSSVPAPQNSGTDVSLSKLPGVWQSLKDQLSSLENLWRK